MKLTTETKLFLGIIAATIAIVGLAAVFLTKPAPQLTRAELIPPGTHTTGNAQAQDYLVEFSDFQCPACKAAKPVVDDILKTYKDKLVFAYRHFPLDQHPFGQKAAEFSEAAATQDKFWQTYEILFANQDKFSDEFFIQLPSQVQLDQSRYATDSASSAIKQRVLTDRADGMRFGVNSTPTFFLNGKKLELASFDELKTLVDQAVQ